jgi:alkylhydroperoxidase family enzyme
MAVVNPLPKEKAASEVRETLEALTKQFGRIPNIFATMAHRPNVLKNFLPLYGAIIDEGTVEARYKELAYLKTSLINGCEY